MPAAAVAPALLACIKVVAVQKLKLVVGFLSRMTDRLVGVSALQCGAVCRTCSVTKFEWWKQAIALNTLALRTVCSNRTRCSGGGAGRDEGAVRAVGEGGWRGWSCWGSNRAVFFVIVWQKARHVGGKGAVGICGGGGVGVVGGVGGGEGTVVGSGGGERGVGGGCERGGGVGSVWVEGAVRAVGAKGGGWWGRCG